MIFTLKIGKMIQIDTAYLSNGLVQAPNRKIFFQKTREEGRCLLSSIPPNTVTRSEKIPLSKTRRPPGEGWFFSFVRFFFFSVFWYVVFSPGGSARRTREICCFSVPPGGFRDTFSSEDGRYQGFEGFFVFSQVWNKYGTTGDKQKT